jgi:hypothetical protein
VAGASAETRRVTYVNANYTVGRADVAAFELMVVTEDEQRHTLQVPASQMAPLLALTQAPGVVLLWDPDGPALIAGNLVGEWIPQTWSSLEQPG